MQIVRSGQLLAQVGRPAAIAELQQIREHLALPRHGAIGRQLPAVGVAVEQAIERCAARIGVAADLDAQQAVWQPADAEIGDPQVGQHGRDRNGADDRSRIPQGAD